MAQRYEKNLPPKGILTITLDSGIYSRSNQYYFENGKFYRYKSMNTEYNKQFPVKKPKIWPGYDFSVREW